MGFTMKNNQKAIKDIYTKEFLSIPEAARLMGITRIALYKQVTGGKVKATRVGRNFVIARKDLSIFSEGTLNEETKKQIEAGVKKVVKQYGETLRLLGNE